MAKRTLYCIIDTETTMKNGLVFDFAFSLVDRHGFILEQGSFLFTDVLSIEEPFYKDKIAEYWKLVYKHKLYPTKIKVARRIFNDMLSGYLPNSKIVLCAYNATFDITHLSKTCRNLNDGMSWLTYETRKLMFMDLWHAWVQGCPVDYGWTAPFVHGDKAGTTNPKTGKPFSWNIKTSAETVYRYIVDNHSFEEKHIAYADLIIERIILLDILRRKKKLPIVSDPSNFVAMPWKIAQQRCRIPIESRKDKQLSLRELISEVPSLTVKNGNFTEDKPTIFFPEEK